MTEPDSHPSITSIRKALTAVQLGRLHNAYDFLPPTYQADIDQLVRDVAGDVDPEAWQAVVRTAQKGVQVLREKKTLILQSLDDPDRQAQIESLTAAWDGLVAALDELTTSDLANLNELQRFDSRRFLETTGNSLFRQLRGSPGEDDPLNVLQSLWISQAYSADGRLVLLITPPGRSEPDHVEFIPVGEHWLPRNLVNAWPAAMEFWRTTLSPGEKAAQQRMLAAMAAVETHLDKMLAAETADDLQLAAQPLIDMLNRLLQEPGPADGVSLTIRGELSEDEHTRLLAELEQLTDNPKQCTYTSTAHGGQAVIALRPVRDVEQFAARLPFGSDVEIDAANRTISLTWKPQ